MLLIRAVDYQVILLFTDYKVHALQLGCSASTTMLGLQSFSLPESIQNHLLNQQ